MDNSVDIDSLCEGMKEMFINQAYGRPLATAGLDVEEVSNSSTLAKKVKTFVEGALMNDLNNKLDSISSSEVDPNMWKVYAHNTAKSLIESPQMHCAQENLNNMLETCTQELITQFYHHFEKYNFVNDTNIQSIDFNGEDSSRNKSNNSCSNMSPLLQPYQFAEIAQNIMPQKPLYLRIQSFDLLLSSQITDAVSSANWPVLQKRLQNILSDENFEIFHRCLKIHAKLVQCSSPEAIKESFLNLLESLCQHYHMQKTDVQEISFQMLAHFRMVRICSLVLTIIKEFTQNLARFGEKRLVEIVENFVHLLSVQGYTRNSDKLLGVSPYDIISCLDPEANWFNYIIHAASSRRLFFLRMSQNNSLQCVIVQEVIDWFNDPVLPSEDVSALKDPYYGKITKDLLKFSTFLHSLSLISKICTFETGLNMFPVSLNKSETVRIQKIAELVLSFLNNQQTIEERMEVIFSDFLTKLIISSAVTLMSVKENHNLTLLQILFEPLVKTPQSPLQHTVSILDTITKQPDGPQNCFFRYGACNKRKVFSVNPSMLEHMGSINSTQHPRSQKELRAASVERQNSVKSNAENQTCAFYPVKILTNTIIKLLRNKDLRDMAVTAKLVDICATLFQLHEGICILEASKSQLIHVAAVVHEELTNLSHKEGGYKILVERNFYLLFSSLQNFIVKIGTTPLGFFLLQEEGIMKSCLCQKIKQPEVCWESPDWKLLLSFAACTKAGAQVLRKEATGLSKQPLLDLWKCLENETDSDIEIDDCRQMLMSIILTFGISLEGVESVINSENIMEDGNSEETITEVSDVRPTTIASLLGQSGLNYTTTDHRVHEVALNILNLLSSNLDSALYLQSKFQIQDKLLQLQSDSRVDGNSDVIVIDECSLLRHEILEKSYLPGPVRSEAKLYHSYPSSTNLSQLKLKPRPRTHGELSKFLQETKNGVHDLNWLKQARKAYRSGCNEEIKSTMFADLISRVQRVMNNSSTNENVSGPKWPTVEDADCVTLFPEDNLGIQLTIRYGIQHRLLQATSQASDNLAQLIRQTKLWLSTDKSDGFDGFDWLVATVFLMCCGNTERCQSILSVLTTLPCATYIWDRYARSQGQSTALFGHLVESVVACELPQAFNALQSNGVSWWLLCQQWMKECFWRLFDWNQICHRLTMCVLHQTDYVLYFCVSVLYQNEQRVLKEASDGSLWKLITNPPDKVCMPDHLVYMDKLWRRHHSAVMPHLGAFP